jgi:hypothetical protein
VSNNRLTIAVVTSAVLQDPALWFDRVGITLLGELRNCEPHVRDRLRDFVLDRCSKHLA